MNINLFLAILKSIIIMMATMSLMLFSYDLFNPFKTGLPIYIGLPLVIGTTLIIFVIGIILIAETKIKED